jgi:nicotinic acid mononucleotide adenylyltransferase
MSSLKRRRRQVCLFGTSANPPTGDGGHVGIVKALCNLERFDEVRVLPVYQHTFSGKRNQLVSFQHRINMCKIAFEPIAKAKISDAEQASFERIAKTK